MRAMLRMVLVGVCAAMAASCFEVEQTLNLQQDMAGDAGITIGIDFEPMVLIMTAMKRSMEGKEGLPTEEELAAARAEFLKKSVAPRPEAEAAVRKQFDGTLPEGVELLDVGLEEDGLRIRTSFRFGFDRLARLTDVSLPSVSDDPTKKNVINRPFEGLDITETPELITIRGRVQNPAASVEKETGDSIELDAETEELVEKAMKNLRVTHRITTPFEVASHNATRVEGRTLVWEYDYDTFRKLEATGTTEIPPIEAAFRKK